MRFFILFVVIAVGYSVGWNGNSIYRKKRQTAERKFEWKPSKTPTFVTSSKVGENKNVPILTIYPRDRTVIRSGRSREMTIEKSQPQRTGARRIIYYATLPEIVRYPPANNNDRFMYQLPQQYNERSYDLPSSNNKNQDFVTKVQSSIIDVKSKNKEEGLMKPTFTIVEADPKLQIDNNIQRYSSIGSSQRPYDQRVTYDLYFQPMNSFYKPASYYQTPYPTRHDRFPMSSSGITQQGFSRPFNNVRQSYKRPQVIQSFITPIDNLDIGPSNFQSDGDFDLNSNNYDSGFNSLTDSFHDSFKDPLRDQFKYFDYNNFLSTTSPLSQKYMDLNTFQSVTSLKRLKPETTTPQTFLTADLPTKPVVEASLDDDYSPGGYGLKLQDNLFPKITNTTSVSNSTESNNSQLSSIDKSN